MKELKIISIFILLFSSVFTQDIQATYEQTANKIIKTLETDSLGYNRLGYLCDMFGPRLSGSRNLERAIDWVIKEMKKDGLSSVKGERVKVPTWIRGKESLKILVPFERDLRVLGIGGSVSTNKAGVRGEVVVVNSFDELEKKKKKIRGKIVLYNVPFITYGETAQYKYDGANRAAKYGAIASLAGLPGHARYVGYTLKHLPPDSSLPWHRVINSKGCISFQIGSEKYRTQKTRLKTEGVVFFGEKISISQYGWIQTMGEP